MTKMTERWQKEDVVFEVEEKPVQNKLFHSGGKGSGHHGHSGRPGQVGGSSDDGGSMKGISQLSNKEKGKYYYHRSTNNATDAILKSGYIQGSEDNFGSSIYKGMRANIGDEPVVFFGVSKSNLRNKRFLLSGWTMSNIDDSPIEKVLVYDPSNDGYYDVSSLYLSGIKTESELIKIYEEKVVIKNKLFIQGGPGSGHHDHKGRPGQVGGSQDESETGKMRIVHHGTSLEAVKKIEKEGLRRKVASIGDRSASVYFMNSFQQTKEYVQDLHLENDQGYAIVSFSIPEGVTVLEDEEEADSYRIEADVPASLIQSITYYDSSNRRIHTQGSRRIGYSIVVFPLGKGR